MRQTVRHLDGMIKSEIDLRKRHLKKSVDENLADYYPRFMLIEKVFFFILFYLIFIFFFLH